MDKSDETSEEISFHLYDVPDGDEVHYLLQAPVRLPEEAMQKVGNNMDVFNILMADVSGSMSESWKHVVNGWTDSIEKALLGTTKIYTFDTHVVLRRQDPALKQEDFDSGGTNLTLALQTIMNEIIKCSESAIRIFIVTDGDHNSGEPTPEDVIKNMSPLEGKMVDVFLLGIGDSFPVNYSVDIRSKLHSGNSNLPSLFWAKSGTSIEEQMESIGIYLQSSLVKISVSRPGYQVPGAEAAVDSVRFGEWLYYPDNIALTELSFTLADETLDVPVIKQTVTLDLLLDHVFRQWNSLLIQLHRRKEKVPMKAFELMDKLFNNLYSKFSEEVIAISNTDKIADRLAKKKLKTYETSHKTLMNLSRKIIEIKGAYENEYELAETILMTTVISRYDVKNLRMKGHSVDDYANDVKEFINTYAKQREAILALPSPSLDQCCVITCSSFLSDLQDESLSDLLQKDKFELLSTLTITGIGIYAPVRDASQINPWVLQIKNILVSPYSVISQRAMELAFQIAPGENPLLQDKDMLLKKDDEDTRVNAVVPVVAAEAARVLKPIVRSNLFAMMATFCILKNHQIVDHNAHLAALGCLWLQSIHKFDRSNRPAYVVDRLRDVVATASLYLDRKGVQKYITVLLKSPKQALMTESVEIFDDKTLKCESMVKPLFLLFLLKETSTQEYKSSMLRLILAEFIGRSLANYNISVPKKGIKVSTSSSSPNSDAQVPQPNDLAGDTGLDVDGNTAAKSKSEARMTSFTEFFAQELMDSDKNEAWVDSHLENLLKKVKVGQDLPGKELLGKYYTLEILLSDVRQKLRKEVRSLKQDLIKVEVNMDKVKQLGNLASCGQVRFNTLRKWASEMDIPEELIRDAFSPKQVLVYVSAALQCTSSRKRLSKDLPSQEEALKTVEGRLMEENGRGLRSALFKQIESKLTSNWRAAYIEAHAPVVMPMTMEEIVAAANERGIEGVSEKTFNQMYKYRPDVRLVYNACQSQKCPHFLRPDRRFNQHISVEREMSLFPHGLHIVSKEMCDRSVNQLVEAMISGKHNGSQITIKLHKHKKPKVISDPDIFTPLVEGISLLMKKYSQA